MQAIGNYNNQTGKLDNKQRMLHCRQMLGSVLKRISAASIVPLEGLVWTTRANHHFERDSERGPNETQNVDFRGGTVAPFTEDTK